MKNPNILKQRPVGEINDAQAQTIVASLNSLLANEYGLFTKTLNYHWNITGPRFQSLHTFLETQYQDSLEIMDNIAERVRVLGETPYCTVEEMHRAMNTKETSGKNLSSSQMIEDLLENNFNIQAQIKETISNEELYKCDRGTEGFLIDLMSKHEKKSWMLKSQLE